jgi:Protein of unknown function (DUF2877)
MTVDESARSSIAILRSGILAQELCRLGAPATVEAVFERSLYLRSGDTFVCIGEADVGNGPLTLIADCGPTRRLSHLGLHPGHAAVVSEQQVTIGDAVAFTLARSRLWRPPEWPAVRSPGELADIWQALTSRAAVAAPDEGLARLVFGSPDGDSPATPLWRIAGSQLASFELWLSHARTHGGAAASAFPDGLVGLGPGLTPSGDDFLMGALALLDALGERRAHATLADAIACVSPTLTSPLSLCFLRAAAHEHIGERLHRMVASVICGDIEAAITAAQGVGHTSGWDMLAGAATAMRIVAAAGRNNVSGPASRHERVASDFRALPPPHAEVLSRTKSGKASKHAQ